MSNEQQDNINNKEDNEITERFENTDLIKKENCINQESCYCINIGNKIICLACGNIITN